MGLLRKAGKSSNGDNGVLSLSVYGRVNLGSLEVGEERLKYLQSMHGVQSASRSCVFTCKKERV